MAAADWLFSLDSVTAALPDVSVPMRFQYALRRGSMKLGLYAPRAADIQGPHKQDELYIVVSSSGVFFKSGERKPFRPHDVIFVEAGADHRFEAFSGDFAAWVVFWGPEGGEA